MSGWRSISFPLSHLASNIKAILVLDNVSHHCCAAEGSINVDSYLSKKAIIPIPQAHGISYREGGASKKDPDNSGHSLEQMKGLLKAWLKENTVAQGILVDKMKVDLLCEVNGHFSPLWTPPYHHELQPIEYLWRYAKMYVALRYVGRRNVTALQAQVRDGVLKYGTAEWVSSHYVRQSCEREKKYMTEGYAEDVIPASWGDYVIIEEHARNDEVDHGIYRRHRGGGWGR